MTNEYNPKIFIRNYGTPTYRLLALSGFFDYDLKETDLKRDLVFTALGAETNCILLSGDEQSGSDCLELSGDQSDGDDVLLENFAEKIIVSGKNVDLTVA